MKESLKILVSDLIRIFYFYPFLIIHFFNIFTGEDVTSNNGHLENGNVKTYFRSEENTTITEASIPSFNENIYTPVSNLERKESLSIGEAKTEQSESSSVLKFPDFSNVASRFVYCLARNLYLIKKIALFLAFMINLFLLFYKVTSYIPSSGEAVQSAESTSAEDHSGGVDSEEDDVIELIQMGEKASYLEPLLRFCAVLHSILSFFMLIAYYNLKVPLIIFKREKEIARKLEFDGLYITDQPEDNYEAYWDKIVISSKSFPVNYWDKFVKKRVRAKYAEQYDYDTLSKLLGMSKSGSVNLEENQSNGFFAFIYNYDWKYQVWKVGVTFMDNVGSFDFILCLDFFIQLGLLYSISLWKF